MLTHVIRQQVAAAQAHPAGSVMLTQRVRQLAGGSTDVAALAELAGHLATYIAETADLLDACAVAADRAGVGAYVAPIVQVAAEYFVAPLDLIPDQHGLYGLLDDAYLARSLVAQVSALYQQRTGLPLLPFDLAAANRAVRVVIGEPLATQLDHAVVQTVAGVVQQVEALAVQGGQLPVDPTGGPGSWGGTFEDEMARLAAASGFSLDF